jgi:hypothetical protein
MRALVRPSVHRLPLAQALLLLAGFTASACTAILVPDKEGKDDGVFRCNNVGDCPNDLDDNRLRYQCVYGEGQDESSSKICVADWEEIGCKATDYGGDHPFVDAYADATDNQSKGLYVPCSVDNLGKQGCGYNADVQCDQSLGLSDRGDGICDDSDSNTPPAISPGQVADDVEVAGQDVLDQFCRWRFGDENWVCDTDNGRFLCTECDSEAEFGKGGCGTLYLQGAPSGTYTDLADANVDGQFEDDLVTFGPIPNP